MRLALILCVCLAPSLVAAAGFQIRSGEHDGFSRLVIYLDRPREWDVAATEAGYEVVVPDSPQGFDTGGVFEFIPRRRLTDVKSAPGRLTLDVPCDCPVQVFAYRPDIVVIDIHSDKPDPDSVPNAEIVMPFDSKPATIVLEGEKDADVPILDVAPSSQTAEALSDWQIRGGTATRATQLLGFSPPATLPDQRLDHSQLVAGIAQAASHGMVTLSDPGARVEATDFPAVPGLRRAGSQVTVRDNLVRGLPPGGLPAASPHCLPAELFAVSDWGDADVPASILLSELRAEGLSGSPGTARSDGAIEMIRSYLFLGFGSEAAALVRTYRMPKRDEHVYRALAEIVDFPGRADRNPLADQLQCDSPAALWAFVASRSLPAVGGDVNADVVLRNFQRLPWWLRLQIGETAAANFDARGDAVSAGSVRASVERARAALTQEAGQGSQDGTPASALPDGDEHHALSDRSHRMRSAQAILYRHKTAGSLPAAEDRAEITALVLETRGSEESVALLENYIEFVSAPDDILAAEKLLTVLSRSRFANAYPLRAAWNQLLEAAVAQPSHDVFLGVLARNKRVFDRTPPDRATADAAIARLVATGLPESAADFATILGASPRKENPAARPAASLSGSNLQSSTRQSSTMIAAVEPGGPGPAVAESTTTGEEDAMALRQLLSTSMVPAVDAEQDGISTDTSLQPTSTPLEALLASEAALEVLGRVLGSTSGADG